MKFYSHYDLGGPGSMIELLKRHGYTETVIHEYADIIVFNGGADIGTEIYGEKPAIRGVPCFASQRDKDEMILYKKYRDDKSKFILGICRGAQLLNCLNGGTLWQHVNHHGVDHSMVDLTTGHIYETTSTHHQMMRPNIEAGKIIAVANESTNKFADRDVLNGIHLDKDIAKGTDIEIVWYPETRTLCVQGHPEYVPGSRFANYVISLMEDLRDQALCAA